MAKVNANGTDVDLKGKDVVVDERTFESSGVSEGDTVTIFKFEDMVNFEFKAKGKDDKPQIYNIHNSVAQVAQTMGKGKIVK